MKTTSDHTQESSLLVARVAKKLSRKKETKIATKLSSVSLKKGKASEKMKKMSYQTKNQSYEDQTPEKLPCLIVKQFYFT